MNDELEKAVAISDNLQTWINDLTVDRENTPTSGVIYTIDTIKIFIDDLCVYCSETDDDEHFSLKDCKEEFLKECNRFAEFIE